MAGGESTGPADSKSESAKGKGLRAYLRAHKKGAIALGAVAVLLVAAYERSKASSSSGSSSTGLFSGLLGGSSSATSPSTDFSGVAPAMYPSGGGPSGAGFDSQGTDYTSLENAISALQQQVQTLTTTVNNPPAPTPQPSPPPAGPSGPSGSSGSGLANLVLVQNQNEARYVLSKGRELWWDDNGHAVSTRNQPNPSGVALYAEPVAVQGYDPNKTYRVK